MNSYEYKFVQIKISMWTMKPKENHHEVIQEHARQGWRLATLTPPSNLNKFTYELIFERAL
jgi:hypothetical protein